MARADELYELAGVVHTNNPSCLVCTPIDGYELRGSGIVLTGINQVNIIDVGVLHES